MKLDDGTYVSFWPKYIPALFLWGQSVGGVWYSENDDRAEQGVPEVIHIDNLNEAAMKSRFEGLKEISGIYGIKYGLRHNLCFDVVANVLVAGGLDVEAPSIITEMRVKVFRHNLIKAIERTRRGSVIRE